VRRSERRRHCEATKDTVDDRLKVEKTKASLEGEITRIREKRRRILRQRGGRGR